MSSCGFLEEEKEPEMIISEIDGEEYIEDMNSEINSRKDTRLIEEGKVKQIKLVSILNIADSLITQNDEWRKRYFTAINIYNETNFFDIPQEHYKHFDIGIFYYFVFHPKALIESFDTLSINQIDFWNERLAAEIKYKTSLDGINEKSIITMAQDNCIECSENEKEFISSMVFTLLKN